MVRKSLVNDYNEHPATFWYFVFICCLCIPLVAIFFWDCTLVAKNGPIFGTLLPNDLSVFGTDIEYGKYENCKGLLTGMRLFALVMGVSHAQPFLQKPTMIFLKECVGYMGVKALYFTYLAMFPTYYADVWNPIMTTMFAALFWCLTVWSVAAHQMHQPPEHHKRYYDSLMGPNA